jgi:hypothetical protein
MQNTIFFSLFLLLLITTACNSKELKTFPFHIDGTLYENCSNKPYSNQRIEITPSVSGLNMQYEDGVKTVETDSLGRFFYTEYYTIELSKKGNYSSNMNFYLPKDSISLYFSNDVDIKNFDFKVQDALRLRLYMEAKSTYASTDTLFYRFKYDYETLYAVPANQQNKLLEDIAIPTYKLSYSTVDAIFNTSIIYAVGRIKLNTSPNTLHIKYANCGGIQNDTIKLD